MLLDTKNPYWQRQTKTKQTKTNPFTLESLIAWLETKPAERTYRYTDVNGCLITQYFQEHGFTRAFCGTNRLYYQGWFKWRRASYPKVFNDVSSGLPYTFGAALERARALVER